MIIKYKKWLVFSGALITLGLIVFFASYFQNVYKAPEKEGRDIYFEVEKGEGVWEIGQKLWEKGLIKSSFWFETYVWLYGQESDFQAGEYVLNTSMPLKEVILILTSGKVAEQEKTITIIEGWNLRDISNYLEEKEISGKKEFYQITGEPLINYHEKTVDPKAFPRDFSSRFQFLKSKPKYYSLEGYLFPDTYKVFQEAGAEEVVLKMISNFDQKLSLEMRKEIEKQGKTIHEVITMASLLEKEVRSREDMEIVSGIFWNRIKNGQALQSCATLAYILGENKPRYSTEDTKIESPFNTYQNKGLPPVPICNPGLKAIEAAINPQNSNYNYFLSRPDTGETVFSETFRKHQQNQEKYLD